jgi:hypothetical protein
VSTTRLTLGKYLCGMAASLIIGLAGGWLILAPFALGYQQYGAGWTNQTVNDFATGIPVAVVALISFALFFMALLGSLRATGVLVSRPKPQPQEALTPVQYQPQVTAPLASTSDQNDLDKTLATLAAALAADLTARRQPGSDQQSEQSIEQVVNRRDE